MTPSHFLYFIGGDLDGTVERYQIPVPVHTGYTYRGAWIAKDGARIDAMAYKGLTFKESVEKARAMAAVKLPS